MLPNGTSLREAPSSSVGPTRVSVKRNDSFTRSGGDSSAKRTVHPLINTVISPKIGRCKLPHLVPVRDGKNEPHPKVWSAPLPPPPRQTCTRLDNTNEGINPKDGGSSRAPSSSPEICQDLGSTCESVRTGMSRPGNSGCGPRPDFTFYRKSPRDRIELGHPVSRIS